MWSHTRTSQRQSYTVQFFHTSLQLKVCKLGFKKSSKHSPNRNPKQHYNFWGGQAMITCSLWWDFKSAESTENTCALEPHIKLATRSLTEYLDECSSYQCLLLWVYLQWQETPRQQIKLVRLPMSVIETQVSLTQVFQKIGNSYIHLRYSTHINKVKCCFYVMSENVWYIFLVCMPHFFMYFHRMSVSYSLFPWGCQKELILFVLNSPVVHRL